MKHFFLPFAAVAAFALFAGTSAFAASATWNGGSGAWATGANWTPTAAPGNDGTSTINSASTATFNTSTGTVTVDSGRNIDNITFASGAGAYTLSGGSLLLTSGGTIQTAIGTTDAETINTPITLEGGYTFTSGNTTTADTLSFGSLGTITNGTTSSATLTLSGANTGTNTISGVITNGPAAIALSKSGAGTWLITNSNNFAGGTTISAGVLQISNRYALNGEADGLGSGAYRDNGVTVNVNGGLAFSTIAGATYSINGLAGSGNESLTDVNSNAITLQLGSVGSTQGTNNNTSYTYTGVLSGAGNIAMNYDNYEIFSGNNSYTGTTTLNGLGYSSYEQGKLFSTLTTSGTPFGTGSVILNSGVLGVAPGSAATGAITDTIASGTGGTFTYDGGYLNLTKGTGASSLTVTIGDASALGTTNVLTRANNGVLVILPGSGTAALGTGTSESLFVTGLAPTVTNGMVSPTILSGGVGSTAGASSGLGNLGDFLTYSVSNGFQSAASSYTPITTATVTPTSTEIGNFNLAASGSVTVTAGSSIYALLIQGNGTVNTTVTLAGVLNVGDNTAGHQAGIIINNSLNTTPISGGTLAFGLDQGIIYDQDGNSNGISSTITGTGGLVITGGSTAFTLSGTNTFSGGLNIQNHTYLQPSSTNSGYGDLQNVITLNGGGFETSNGNQIAGRSVVLLSGGGTYATGNQLSNFGWNTSGSGILLAGGGQQVVLSGNNTQTGGLGLITGETAFSSDANLGGATEPISFLTDQSSNVILSVMGLYGNGLANSFGSHPISFVYSGGGATLSLDIQNAANVFTVTTPLAMGSNALSKYGPGTLVLNGGGTYTGATNLLGGILQVNEGNGSLNSTTALNFQGGTLDIVGAAIGATAQTFGNVTVTGASGTTGGGGSELIVSSGGGSGTTVTLGTLAQSVIAGSALEIDAASSSSVITTTSAPDITTGAAAGAGIYGGRVVYTDSAGNVDWATSASGSSPFTLSRYTNYKTLAASVAGSILTDNIVLSATDTSSLVLGGGPYVFNSLKINNTATGTLGLNGNTLALTSGGLLFTGTSAFTIGSSIGDGSVVAGIGSNGTNTDLIVQDYGTAALTISSTITNATNTNGGLAGANNTVASASTLTKAGTGTLILTGANTYTGKTYIDGGILSISSDSNLGGSNGSIGIASSLTTSPTVTLTSATLPAGFGVGSTLLGRTVNAINLSTLTVTLSGNASTAITSSTASFASAANINLNGGTLQANTATSFTLTESGTTGALGGTQTVNRGIVLGSNGGTIDIIGGGSLTVASGISAFNTGNGAGDGSLTLTSSDNNAGDTLILTSNASFSEGVNINGGTLETSASILNSGDMLTFGTSTATVETLMMNNQSAVIAGLVAGSSNAIIENNTTSGSGVTLTDLQGGNTTYAGTIINGPVTSSKTVNLVKSGAGTLTLTNTGSSYTGTTEIDNGILNVASLGTTEGSAGGTNSSIGASGNAATNLIFGGGTNGTAVLQYNGTSGAISTDRLFTLGDINGTSATLDSSSATAADTLSFTNSTGSIAISAVATNGADTHNLTLTGTNTGTASAMNTFAPKLVDGTQPTSLSKTGAGSWAVTNANTYSGGTTVSGGTLLAGNTTAGGSATGTGALNVNGGATIGGYGTSSGTSFSISGTGTTTGTRANVLAGMNSPSDTNVSAVLTLKGSAASTFQDANLTFNLNSAVAGGLGTDPTNSGTELSVGNTAITFGLGTQSTILTLNLQGSSTIAPNTPYVLFAGLTSGGADQYTNLSLGTSTGTLASGLSTSILNSGIGGTGNLALSLSGANTNTSFLFLYQNSTTGADDIEVEVVPEPSTWAMMLGGFGLLVFFQRRKFSKIC